MVALNLAGMILTWAPVAAAVPGSAPEGLLPRREQQAGEDRKGRKCFRCGKGLPPGNLAYVTQIRIFAGFDGILLEPEEGVDRQLRQLLEPVEQSNPEDLEKEIYQEFNLILCKSCRDRLVDEIEHPREGPFQIRRGPGRFIH